MQANKNNVRIPKCQIYPINNEFIGTPIPKVAPVQLDPLQGPLNNVPRLLDRRNKIAYLQEQEKMIDMYSTDEGKKEFFESIKITFVDIQENILERKDNMNEISYKLPDRKAQMDSNTDESEKYRLKIDEMLKLADGTKLERLYYFVSEYLK